MATRTLAYDDVAGLPTVVQAPGSPFYIKSLPRSFDPVTGLYGATADNSRVFDTAKEAARNGTGVCHDVVLGASGESAFDGTTLRAPLSWPTAYRSMLAQGGIPSGGTGMFPASDTNPNTFQLDARCSVTGTWATLGGDFAYTGTSGNTYNFTPDVGGGFFKLQYGNASLTFTVKIGAAAPVTINPTGAANLAVYTSPAVVPAGTLITITASGTISLFALGTVATASGYHMHNLARSSMGATIGGAGQFGADTEGAWDPTISPNYYSPAQSTFAMISAAGINAHRLTVAVGGNDLARGKTAAQVIASLDNIITAVPKVTGATVRLVLTWQLGLIADADWEEYGRQLYAYADSRGYQLADWRYFMGNFAAMQATGVLGADGYHTTPPSWVSFGRRLAIADNIVGVGDKVGFDANGNVVITGTLSTGGAVSVTGSLTTTGFIQSSTTVTAVTFREGTVNRTAGGNIASNTAGLITCDATSGAQTHPLYNAATTPGQRFTLIKTDTSANTVTLSVTGTGGTIGGATTFVLSGQYDAVTVESTNVAGVWHIVGRPRLRDDSFRNLAATGTLSVTGQASLGSGSKLGGGIITGVAYTITGGAVKYIEATAAVTVTLPSASAFTWFDYYVTNSSAGNVTLTGATSTETIGNTTSAAQTLTVGAGSTVHVYSNGTKWRIA